MKKISNTELAINGGPKIITKEFKKYNSIGMEEAIAAKEVIDSGVLSQFLGCWAPDFYGGPKVQEFERAWENKFSVKNAISVNSATSALIAAIGAIGVEPGDEVIVSPWTMCASATSILHWNAIPVFADIELDTFCLDPRSVLNNITPHTKAIVSVDIFGHSSNMDSLMSIANTYGIKVISDTAQAPGALYNGRYAGTQAHVGCYSLNYHKHIHTGEGGIVVTNDDEIAERVRLIRNHAEAVVGDIDLASISNMIGYNFRLGEIECAIGLEQLKKLDNLVAGRQRIAERLSNGLLDLPGLRTPVIESNCTHAYYAYPILLDKDILRVSCRQIYDALRAEGVPIGKQYQNVHLLPMYQKKIAYGTKGFPWTSEICRRDVNYDKGICPVAEGLNDDGFLILAMCTYDYSDSDVDLLIKAFYKVWNGLEII